MFSQDTTNMFYTINDADHLTNHMLNSDPPNHNRLRSFVQKKFYTEDDFTITGQHSINCR